MPRIRTIKPEFWESESVACLSFGARLLFLASLNLADDDGLLRWNAPYLSAHAFMYDDIDQKTIEKWMKEVETNGFIFPYKAGKMLQSLGWIVKFTKHQVINRPQPSKLPAPSIQSSKVKQLYFERDEMICHICKGKIDLSSPLKEVGSKNGSLDHLHPVSKGGTDHPSNIRVAHISCNIKKGAKLSEIITDESLTNSLSDSVNDSLPEGKRKGREKEREVDEEWENPPDGGDDSFEEIVFLDEHSLTEKKENDSPPGSAAPPSLIFPYDSEGFLKIWNVFISMPKQKKKPFESKQAMLMALSDFDEEFSIQLINKAISGNYQGLVFHDTKESYERYLKQKNGQQTNGRRDTSNHESLAAYNAKLDAAISKAGGFN